MQTSSIVTDVVNNFVVGDVYISVRNELGTEITQIHPVRTEDKYEWFIDQVSGNIHHSLGTTYYCKFKLDGKLTPPCDLDTIQSLFPADVLKKCTLRWMPYNYTLAIQFTGQYGHVHTMSLARFILRAFPDIPKTTVHNYERMKTGESVGIKRKREK